MDTLEIALENYYQKDDNNKEIDIVLLYFGRAVYFTQALEDRLLVMLRFYEYHNNDIKPNHKVNGLYNYNDYTERPKMTLSNFINEVKRYYKLTDDLRDDLESILEKRNFIVHNYFKINSGKGYSHKGRCEMLEYFTKFINEAKRIDSELENYYSKYRNETGLTKEKLDQLVTQMIMEKTTE